jgi:hypothetical protein
VRSPGAITWSLDNFQGFAAKNENYNWRLLGEKSMLASIAAGHVPEVTCPTDGGASACPEGWELRRMYIVEGRARLDRVPDELFGRHVMYLDAEAECIMYQTHVRVDSRGIRPISFDRNEAEPVPQDQFLRDAGAHAVEL